MKRSKSGYDIPDSHLQSPIRYTQRKLYTSPKSTNIPKHILQIRSVCPHEQNTLIIQSEKLYGFFLHDVFNRTVKVGKWVHNYFPYVHQVVSKFVQDHTVAVIPFVDQIFQKEIPEFLERMYYIKTYWEQLRTLMQDKKNRQDLTWDKFNYTGSITLPIDVSQSFITIVKDGVRYLMDYDQVMLLADSISSRVFFCWYMYLLGDFPSTIPHQLIVQLYAFYDSLIEIAGNNSYDSVKTWESLVMGIMLKKYDPLLYADAYLKYIMSEVKKAGLTQVVEMAEFIEKLNLNVYQLAELHGIYRHWGHPTVDELAGCKKIRGIVHVRKVPKGATIKKMIALFKRQFCISFITTHGRWPRICTLSMNKSSLRRAIDGNMTHINLLSSSYSIHDWSLVQFEKEFDFDYYPDFTELCDDKAISVYRDEVHKIFSPDVLGYDPGKPTTSRRVLLEMLRQPSIDIKKICDNIMKRDVPDNWKIVLLHSKEREMKTQPRMFAMLVLEMRIYFCVTEANIAKKIFPYFPQQTMTMTESELTKRLYDMSKAEKDVYCPIFASIDFKSWNLHWSTSSTNPFFKVLDDLFGTPGLFTYTHTFFQDSLVMLSSYYDPPSTLINRTDLQKKNLTTNDLDTILCTTVWDRHYGGFEGLRQKGWTLITICLLLLVESTTGLKFYIIGQGDNQVCKILVPKLDANLSSEEYIKQYQEDVKNRLDEFFKDLTTYADHIGLVVKQEESWVSSTLINYGKEILYKGAFLPSASKRISRTLPDVNEVYPTCLSKISTLQTTGLATSQKGYHIILPYLIVLVETCLTVAREIDYSIITQSPLHQDRNDNWALTESGIMLICHGDANLFNLPVANFFNYLYRGHPDPLTAYLSFIWWNVPHCMYCRGIYHLLEYKILTPGASEPLLLISDPLSLNIDRPQQVAFMLKKYVHEAIVKKVQNDHLKDIFHINSILEDEELITYLMGTEPFYPRILHEIMRVTPTGTRLGIISKFSNTRTIFQVTNFNAATHFFDQIKRSERENIRHWFIIRNLISHVTEKHTSRICPTQLAKDLRNYYWSPILNDKKIEGVTVPYPLHQFIPSYTIGTDHKPCRNSGPFILISLINNNQDFDLVSTRGPVVPYIGSSTKEKITGKILQLPETSRPIESSKRLVQIRNWCVDDQSPFNDFINMLTRLHTNLPSHILELVSGTIESGSVMHRFNDHITKKKASMNVRPNISSHIYISTDEMGKYGKGSANVNIHFQGGVLCSISLMQIRASLDVTLKKGQSLHLHYNCLVCEEYVPDCKIRSTDNIPNIQSNIRNPLLYTTSSLDFNAINPTTSFITLVHASPSDYAAASVIFSKILKGMKSIIWGSTEKSAVMVSNLSIQDIVKLGLSSIINSLAHYLFLYMYDGLHLLDIHLQLISDYIWREITPFCLLPELLPELARLADDTQVSSPFETGAGVNRLLTRSLVKAINEIKKKYQKSKDTPIEKRVVSPVFYLMPGCPISKIMTMWMIHLNLISNGELNLIPIFRKANIQFIEGFHIPSESSMRELYRQIFNVVNKTRLISLFSRNPLRVSKLPPDAVLGNNTLAIDRDFKKKFTKYSAVKPAKIAKSEFPLLMEFPVDDSNLVPRQSFFHKESITKVPRVFVDHYYSIVGNLSGSFLKILQIIMTFGINISKECICLADGDGGISRLLYNCGAPRIIYNSKVDTSRLIAQRAINYTPSEFMDIPDKVIGGSLCALLGGDLLNDEYFSNLMYLVPQQASVVTMDAESDKPFTPNDKIQLIIRTLKIAFKSNSDYIIFKTYIDHAQVLCQLIGIMATVYKKCYLCVPVYSSNENYEVYLVGTSFSPKVTQPEIGLYTTSISSSYLGALNKIKRSQRIQDYPFQDNKVVWREIIGVARKIGYDWNLTYNLELFTDSISPYDTRYDIKEWLQRVMECCKSYLIEEVKGIAKSCKGKPLSKMQALAITSNTTTHVPIEKLCLIILNIQVLQDTMQCSTYNDVQRAMSEGYEKGYDLVIDKSKIYSVKKTIAEVHSKYQKALWRILGNIRIRDL
uniref:RNA-directed RNA polymerase L n=1 Tax=Crocidura lasiura lispivirus 2 TaxID=3139472 RepID=A0AB38ZJM8_9MONO